MDRIDKASNDLSSIRQEGSIEDGSIFTFEESCISALVRKDVLTYIGDFLANRDLDSWAFLLNNGPDDFFMLGGKINRRVNGRYRYGFDTLFSNFRTSTSNLVRIDLGISTDNQYVASTGPT